MRASSYFYKQQAAMRPVKPIATYYSGCHQPMRLPRPSVKGRRGAAHR